MSNGQRVWLDLRTSVNNIVLVQIIDGFQHLSNCLCSILLRKLSFLADAVEEFSARGKLCYNVVFVLTRSAPDPDGDYSSNTYP